MSKELIERIDSVLAGYGDIPLSAVDVLNECRAALAERGEAGAAPNDDELLPCPFCGGKATHTIYEGVSYVMCGTCGAQTDAADTMPEADAVMAWNRRAAPAPAAPVNELMRHAANEWEDMATNGLQWARNIADGISTPEDAVRALEHDLDHCQEVANAATLAAADAAPAAPGVTDERMTPVHCESKGASDYCAHCGDAMDRSSPSVPVCQHRDIAKLSNIPDEDVVAFGCAWEAQELGLGIPEQSQPCKKWCKRRDCPVSLKPILQAKGGGHE